MCNVYIKIIEFNSSYEHSKLYSGPDFDTSIYLYIKFIHCKNNTGWFSFTIEGSPINHIIEYCNVIKSHPTKGLFCCTSTSSTLKKFIFLNNYYSNELICFYSIILNTKTIFFECIFDLSYNENLILNNQNYYLINNCNFKTNLFTYYNFNLFNTYLCGKNLNTIKYQFNFKLLNLLIFLNILKE